MKIKVLCLSLVLLLTASLVACASSPEDVSTSGPVITSAALTPTASEVGAVPDEATPGEEGNLLPDLFEKFLGFAGAGSAVAVIVSLLKLPATLTKGRIVLIHDGWSGNLVTLLNLLLFGGFAYAKIFYPDFDFDSLNGKIEMYANYAVMLLGLVVQIFGATKTYEQVSKAAPVVSYSAMNTFTA